jgi:hypothetical protein
MEQAHQFFERLLLSTGQASRHFQASISALKSGIRDGWLVAFKISEGHCRKELEGCSAPSDSMGYFSAQSLYYIFVSLFPIKTHPPQNFSQTYSLMTYGAFISTPQRMGMTPLFMNANLLPLHLAEVEDDDMLDTTAHQWLKRDICMRTHVVGQSSEWPQEWKSVSIP